MKSVFYLCVTKPKDMKYGVYTTNKKGEFVIASEDAKFTNKSAAQRWMVMNNDNFIGSLYVLKIESL